MMWKNLLRKQFVLLDHYFLNCLRSTDTTSRNGIIAIKKAEPPR